MRKIEKAPAFDAASFDVSVLSDPAMIERVREYNERYLHRSELRYRTDDESERSALWNVMKLARDLSSQRLELCGRTYTFRVIPRFTDLLHFIDRESEPAVLERMPEGMDADRLRASALMEEAVASSRMEGAAIGRRDARRMLASGRRPTSRDELMVLGNHRAMLSVMEHAHEDLTPETILELHRAIVSGTLRDGDEWEGRFRESDDIVVGDPLDGDAVYHVPPAHDRIPEMIDRLCGFANSDSSPFIHPVVKAVILHYMIGWIHPFVDGNGRLARCLFYWHCIRSGYRLFEFVSISGAIGGSKTRYGDAYRFTETDGDDLTYFIGFNLECIRRSVDSLTAYLDRKSAEQGSALCLIERDDRLGLLEATLLEDMARDRGTFSIYEVRNRYGVAYETARKHVIRLNEMGYLRLAGRRGKRQLYVVSGGRDPGPPTPSQGP